MKRTLDNKSSDNSTCPSKKKKKGIIIATNILYASSLGFVRSIFFVDCEVKIL